MNDSSYAENWAAAADRHYFQRHPKRRYRCRRPVPGEFWDVTGREAVLVIKVDECLRLRRGVDGRWLNAPDHALEALVDWMMGG